LQGIKTVVYLHPLREISEKKYKENGIDFLFWEVHWDIEIDSVDSYRDVVIYIEKLN